MERIDSLPPEIELALLVQRCAARDVAAFRLLYDKTSPIVYARLLRMLRRRSVAEAALQEAYVRAWERAAQFEVGRGRPLAWLMAIARYCAIDFMRHEGMTLVPDDEVTEVPAEDSAPDSASNHFDDRIGRLPGDTRQWLALAYVEGRSSDQIAQLTSSPRGAVKGAIRRGLASLRHGLPDAGAAG
jgi:RNA polymerase sigma-70 factor (ECF subfamily)